MLIGGSPCTHWSIAQKNGRETEPSGIGWELFRNYLIAKDKFQPDFFLYENNKSAAEPIKAQIRKELGVTEGNLFEPDNGVRFTYINSALVSAQNRQRFYVTNFGDIEQPADRGILLKDILESGDTVREKSYCIDANYHKATNGTDAFNGRQSGNRLMVAEPVPVGETNGKSYAVTAYYSTGQNPEHTLNKSLGTMVAEPATDKSKPVYEVRNGLITIKGKQYPIKLPDGYYIIRKLTVTECCRLQTMPDDYCRAVSPTQGYKGLGNGWTAEVIIHLLNHAKIPLDEEIVCLSMYDGIGTGRYCLDKMGYKNVKYFAYEIDKYAIQIANSNYPDIIQCGDAFQVRNENWEIC